MESPATPFKAPRSRLRNLEHTAPLFGVARDSHDNGPLGFPSALEADSDDGDVFGRSPPHFAGNADMDMDWDDGMATPSPEPLKHFDSLRSPQALRSPLAQLNPPHQLTPSDINSPIPFCRASSKIRLAPNPATPRSLLQSFRSQAQIGEPVQKTKPPVILAGSRHRQRHQLATANTTDEEDEYELNEFDSSADSISLSVHDTDSDADDVFLRPRSARRPRNAIPHHLRSQGLQTRSLPASRPSSAQANVNPFKRFQSQSSSEQDGQGKRSVIERSTDYPLPTKSGRFQTQQNISRFAEEFLQKAVLGNGEFGTVLKCVNKLDGIVYAIKRSKHKISSMGDEQALLREVYAHAVIQDQMHIVRYHSAWEEDDHMLIQNEYCDQGSFNAVIAQHRAVNARMKQEDLCKMLRHISRGLQSLHRSKLVHLDVKPANIFLKVDESAFPEGQRPNLKTPMGLPILTHTIFKLGDLGMVTRVSDPHVEEGDCRYLAPELLQDDHRDLYKADVFSLGVSAYEAATGFELENNGPQWQHLRSGRVEPVPHLSAQLNELLWAMLNPDPAARPTITMVLQHPALLQEEGLETDTARLQAELRAERSRNQLMQQALEHLKKGSRTADRMQRKASCSF